MASDLAVSDDADVSEARQRFERELRERGVPADTARRIASVLEQRYSSQIVRASRTDVLRAASWAAERLWKRFSPAHLERADLKELAAALADGCPLCA